MRLSEDLATLEAWLATVAAGMAEFTPGGFDAFGAVLRRAVARAEELETALASTAELLSPSRNHAAVREAIQAGKVELLAAHRIARLPEAIEPERIA